MHNLILGLPLSQKYLSREFRQLSTYFSNKFYFETYPNINDGSTVCHDEIILCLTPQNVHKTTFEKDKNFKDEWQLESGGLSEASSALCTVFWKYWNGPFAACSPLTLAMVPTTCQI